MTSRAPASGGLGFLGSTESKISMAHVIYLNQIVQIARTLTYALYIVYDDDYLARPFYDLVVVRHNVCQCFYVSNLSTWWPEDRYSDHRKITCVTHVPYDSLISYQPTHCCCVQSANHDFTNLLDFNPFHPLMMMNLSFWGVTCVEIVRR